MKWIKRIVVLVVLVALAGAGLTWLMLDTIAKKGIQQGGEFALGVPTDVEQVNLSLLNGTLMIDKLKVSNPEGFSTPHLIQTGRFELEVTPGSVISSPVDVQKFVLDGLDVNIEQTPKGNNVSVILANVKKVCGDEPAKDQPAQDQGAAKDAGPGRKIKVGQIVVKNVVAHIQLPLGPAGKKDIIIRLPAIELDDVTKDSPEGVTVGGLVSRIVPAILAAIVKEGKGIIPGDLAGAINTDIAGAAGAIGGRASELVQQIGGDASAAVRQNADKAVAGLQKRGLDAFKGIGSAINKPKE